MSEERKQILQMLAEGKINAEEAERLLDALQSRGAEVQPAPSQDVAQGTKPKFLHIKVEGDPKSPKQENVDIKIPIMLLKAGMKLTSLVPESVRGRFSSQLSDKGIDLDLSKLNGEAVDTLIKALTETSIDVDSDNEKVRIYCA